VSTLPTVVYACSGNCFYSLNVEHPYQTITYQHLHRETSLVVQNVSSLGKRHTQQMHRPSGNSQHSSVKRRISILAGERDSYQGGSSVAATIQGQNSTPSSLLKNYHIADNTQQVTFTPSATQRRSMYTPTATLGTPSPGGSSQIDSMGCVVSSNASGIASTPIPLSGLGNLPIPILNRELRMIINHLLSTPAREINQRRRKWQW
jgi:hypothetical protein